MNADGVMVVVVRRCGAEKKDMGRGYFVDIAVLYI